MSKLEKSVEDHLVDIVEKLGGITLKGDISGRRFIDRIIILPKGVTIWCEVKRPAVKRVTAHQEETLDRLEKKGHVTWKVNNREIVDEFFKTADTYKHASDASYLSALKSFCRFSSLPSSSATSPRRLR